MEQAIAWKYGVFNFNHADLPTVMRQVEPWYDVEVMYEGEDPKIKFGGKVQRNLNLSQVLRTLSNGHPPRSAG